MSFRGFCRRNSTVAVTGSPELEKRISAIVSTGEEQTSYTEADERLRAWQRKRRFNRRGQLPELEGRMDEAQRRLDEMESSLSEQQRLETELEQTRQTCAQLEQQVMDSRRRQRQDALQKLNTGRGELRQVSAEHDASMAALSQARDALRSSSFGERDPGELGEEIQRDLAQLRRLSRQPKSGPLLKFHGLYSPWGCKELDTTECLSLSLPIRINVR